MNIRNYRNLIMFLFTLLLVSIGRTCQCEEDVSFTTSTTSGAVSTADINSDVTLFQIEGKVTPPDIKPNNWYWTTRILIDGGKRVAFIKVRLNL